MARSMTKSKSAPEKTGMGYLKSTEVCTRHMEVKICGQPEDVKQIMLLLAQQERDQPAISASDAEDAASDREDEIGDTATHMAPPENIQHGAVESPDADDNCPCWKPEFGRKLRITEEEET